MAVARVIVVGGGVAGLTAARVLSRDGYSVKVLEQEDSPGGRVGTEKQNGITFNRGARLLYSFSDPLNQLLDELNLSNQMQSANQLAATCNGLNDDWLIYLLPDLKSIVTPGLKLTERIRLLRHAATMWALRKNANPDDAASVIDADNQSLQSYIHQHVGHEFLRRVIEPVFTGARVWRPREISAAFYLTTAPNLFRAKVMVPTDGMQALPNALAKDLDIDTGVQVHRVNQGDICRVVAIKSAMQVTYEADYVVCAVPGNLVPDLVDGLDNKDRRFFEQVEYNSYGAVHYLLDHQLPANMRFFDADSAQGVALFQQDPVGRQTQVTIQLSPEFVDIAHRQQIKNKLGELVQGRAAELCPALKTSCIAQHEQWIERMLPLFKPGYCRVMREFRDRQEASKRRVYFCGDYLAQALVNGAVASGQRAANALKHHWHKSIERAASNHR